MKPKEFANYKNQFLWAIREILAKSEPGSLDEAAFPAYSHTNPLINFLFWERIRKVINHLEPASPYNLVMDFGCGSGILLPFLSGICTRVIAYDIDLSPVKKVKEYVNFPKNVEFYDPDNFDLLGFSPASFDVIITLDVLEHVDDLQNTMAVLCKLLTPRGKIIISGPTENPIYQLGRRLAGSEYSGVYHKRNIYQIKRMLSILARVHNIATLFYPLPLFEVFYGEL